MLFRIYGYCGVSENENYDFIRVMTIFARNASSFYTNFQVNTNHSKEYTQTGFLDILKDRIFKGITHIEITGYLSRKTSGDRARKTYASNQREPGEGK